MLEKCKSFLYMFDLIGTSPELFIFKSKRYKTIFSSTTSIIIFLFSLIFVIFSINEYLKYNSPFIVYSRNNDQETERSIFIKNTPLLFQLIDINTVDGVSDSVGFFEADYIIIYDNGTVYSTALTIENCEIGKNIDSKYKDMFDDKYKFGRNIEDLYCFNPNNENFSLFYDPKAGFSLINVFISIKKNNEYIPEKLQSLIISESDLIDHNSKDNPISKSYIYQLSPSFSSLEYTKNNYNFQYVKYETDDGPFYSNSKILNGMSFSDMTYYRNIQDDYDLNKSFEKSNSSRIGAITFTINKSSFDNYKRTYKRLQSLLADIMSVISLLFETGRQLSIILCNKKMSIDIISSLIENTKKDNLNQKIDDINKIFKNNKKDILNQQNVNISNILNKKEKNSISSSERKIVKKIMIDKANNLDNLGKEDQIKISKTLDISRYNKNDKINTIYLHKRIINEIHFWNIIKSYFCFKDKKKELIDFCHNTIIEDMCVERILRK